MGVVTVRLGIVVDEFERDGRPRGKELGMRVSEDALPVEIPVADVDQPLPRAVGQRRVALDLLREEVRVRLNRVEVGVTSRTNVSVTR